MASAWRVGCGWDRHRLVPGRRLVLGGVEIPFERGLDGHSDADVLLHAVIDALLGALGEGDIGTLFPDDDPTWKDASSLAMLKIVVDLMHTRGWSLGNLDTTVIAEAPRIGPHREPIRARIGEALGVPAEAIAIKAKTAEGCGAEGCGEAISALAVVLLVRAEQAAAPASRG